MKKLIFLSLFLGSLSLTSCKSTKGCGLTSDIQKYDIILSEQEIQFAETNTE